MWAVHPPYSHAWESSVWGLGQTALALSDLDQQVALQRQSTEEEGPGVGKFFCPTCQLLSNHIGTSINYENLAHGLALFLTNSYNLN